ncbi:hypothetical protein AwDysgo_02480 [Bacteroidales bacterium]|nr:hypothetical protein AwDysgo_02480 [Bacteroidales bacterium]
MIIAVDFDGTIVEHAYPKIGKPVPFAMDVLKRLQAEEAHTFLLWTVRSGKLLDEAVEYCEKNGFSFYAANKNSPEEDETKSPRKLLADLFIDDRNFGGLPDWGVIYKVIKKGGKSLYDFEEMMNDDQGRQKRSNKNFFIKFGEAWDRARGRGF